MTAPKHQLYTTADKDAPASIKDSNGVVALGLCKVCGRGEVELSAPCRPKRITCSYIGRRDGSVFSCKNKAMKGSKRCHVHGPPPDPRHP